MNKEWVSIFWMTGYRYFFDFEYELLGEPISGGDEYDLVLDIRLLFKGLYSVDWSRVMCPRIFSGFYDILTLLGTFWNFYWEKNIVLSNTENGIFTHSCFPLFCRRIFAMLPCYVTVHCPADRLRHYLHPTPSHLLLTLFSIDPFTWELNFTFFHSQSSTISHISVDSVTVNVNAQPRLVQIFCIRCSFVVV